MPLITDTMEDLIAAIGLVRSINLKSVNCLSGEKRLHSKQFKNNRSLHKSLAVKNKMTILCNRSSASLRLPFFS